MTRRLRVMHVVVRPVLVWDDGETLTAGPQAAPVSVLVSELAGLADRLPAEVAQLQAQAEQADAEQVEAAQP